MKSSKIRKIYLRDQNNEYLISEAKKIVPVVETGIFGAAMDVTLQNDGPFTIILDESTFNATI